MTIRPSTGKVLSGATRKTFNRLAEALRLAAFGLERDKCRLGEYCRRMKGRLGKAEGITATAHKLARVIHAMIASDRGYDEAEACRRNPSVEQKRLKTPSSKAWVPTSFNPASYNEFVRRTDPIDVQCLRRSFACQSDGC